MLLGLVGALACAVAYGVATVLQAVGSRRMAVVDGLDLTLLARLVRSGPYAAGLFLDAAGFGLAILALRTLPLFLVQSAIASSVGVTAVASARWLHTPLGRPQIRALLGLGVGLALLAAAAQPETARPVPLLGQWAVLAGLLPVLALTASSARWRRDRAAQVLAVAAGLGFGGVGIAARALGSADPWWQVARSPLLWAVAGYGLVALYCYAAALQRGSATVVSAITFTVETVVPAAIGLAVLGDSARPGFGPVAAAGFVATVAAAVMLARTSPA